MHERSTSIAVNPGNRLQEEHRLQGNHSTTQRLLRRPDAAREIRASTGAQSELDLKLLDPSVCRRRQEEEAGPRPSQGWDCIAGLGKVQGSEDRYAQGYGKVRRGK